MTSTVSFGAASSSVPIVGLASISCSRLSSTSRRSWSRSCSITASARSPPVAARTRRALAISAVTSAGSLTGAEIDEEHPVGVTIEPFPGDLEREPGLARAAGTRQREQAGAVQQAVDLHDLGRPADEGRSQRGQVRPPRIERAQRREVGVEPVDRQIVQMLGAIEILETVDAEVAERDALGERIRQERPRRFGDHDLAAVARGSDPCRTVDVDPDVVVAAQDTVAAVQTHPDANLAAVGPRVGREPSLRRHRCSGRSTRGREHREERVTLRADLHAVSLARWRPA